MRAHPASPPDAHLMRGRPNSALALATTRL
jgi:hypothetical protein